MFLFNSVSDSTNKDISANSFLIKSLFSITDSIDPPYYRFSDSNTDIRSSMEVNLEL